MRRLLAAIMIVSTASFVAVMSQGASASGSVAQTDFVNKINSYRASQGVGGVQSHPVLTAKAQGWAQHMAATGCLCHSKLTDGVSVSWKKLGENVGRGSNVASLHAAFINSPQHRANMLDRQYQWVGIGVAPGRGQMWVAEVFMNGAGPATAAKPSGTPRGSVDSAVRGPGIIGVNGWALDPDTKGSLQVHVYVDGRPVQATTANRTRTDIGRKYPGYGNQHGFSTNVGVGTGDHTVCAYAINQYHGRGNPQLGCKVVRNTPFGRLDGANPTPSGTRVVGWAIGRDVTHPLAVHLYFNGHIVKAVTAGNSRTDVSYSYPQYGTAHGFAVDLPNQSGTLCAYAINPGGGRNSLIGCRFVNTNPTGVVDAAGRWGRGVRVSGWAVDPDTNGSVGVHVYVNGRGVAAIQANNARADLAALAAHSSNHAYDAVVPVGAGRHSVCLYAINRGSGSGNSTLGCRTVG